ncbi:response regulator [Roseiconus nitratireducens]|nr:response regulator [Roseiconus nitratireducens]
MLPNDEKEILYVDDEATALKYFGQLFGTEFRISRAASGEEAWDYIRQNPDRIAVLITDQRMGPVSGVQLMERVRTCYPRIVRILITAYTQLDYAVKAVNEGGAFRYLTKPFDEQEMIGTLTRACEFHQLMVQRDRLMEEKLSVLHRLVVMDRIRGLVAAVTGMNGRVRGAWPALASYMAQSPVKERIKVQLDEIAELDLSALAKRETREMVDAITTLLKETVGVSTGDAPNVDAASIAREVAEAKKIELLQDDLDLAVTAKSPCPIESDAGMLKQLYEILLRRLSDVQDQPSKIDFSVHERADDVVIEARGSFRSLNEDQFASLFAAAIPIHKWPIGLDMDLLSAFLIAHHLGGRLRVEPQPPSGPGIKVTLPKTIPVVLKAAQIPTVQAEWFDAVYTCMEAWEQEIAE